MYRWCIRYAAEGTLVPKKKLEAKIRFDKVELANFVRNNPNATLEEMGKKLTLVFF